METKDNKATVLGHYKKLYRELDPHAAGARCGIEFDSEEGCFSLNHLGERVTLCFPEFRAVKARDQQPLSEGAQILLIRYIIEGAGGHWAGKFLSYSEMPWGSVYLSNFKGRCIARLAFGLGFDFERFKRACAALGGVPAPGGDIAFDIEFIQGFTVRVILWAPDDEFPPNAQILFSDNFPLAFTAEDMAVVGDVLIDAMKKVR